MLPSKKRLSRSEIKVFLEKKTIKKVFNSLGTIKYNNSQENKACVVISSKSEKLAYKRNKLKRIIYNLFSEFFKNSQENKEYMFFASKTATKISFEELKTLFYELYKKTTK